MERKPGRHRSFALIERQSGLETVVPVHVEIGETGQYHTVGVDWIELDPLIATRADHEAAEGLTEDELFAGWERYMARERRVG